MTPSKETCTNCGREIGKLEQAFLHDDNIVCKECRSRLASVSADSPSIPTARGWKGRSKRGPALLIGLVCIGLVVGVAVYNGFFDNETYEGKSIHEWLTLSQDKDTDTRVKAVLALGHMQSRRAEDAVKRAALDDYWWEVRAAALQSYADLTDEEEIRVLESMIKTADPYYTKPVTCDAFIYKVDFLGPKAKSLAPILRKLRDEIGNAPYPDEVALDLIDESLDAIEGTNRGSP